MELIERTSTTECRYLSKMSFTHFKTFASNCKNDAERRKTYDKLQHFVTNHLKARGEIKRLYNFTLSTNWGVGGRLFCGGSVQSLPKIFRGFLLGKTTTDIDMVNAHPVLLLHLCNLHKIHCPELSYYIKNRDAIFESHGSNRDTVKKLYLKAVNDDKINRTEENPSFKSFDKEMKRLQKVLTSLPEYSEIVKTTPAHKLYNNWYGSAINRILCSVENEVLQVVISVLNKRQIEMCGLMCDGVLIYGDFYNDPQLLRDIELEVECKFPNMGMCFDYKQHSSVIRFPDNWEDTPDDENKLLEKSFETVAEEFELTHCKIINKNVFIKKLNNDNIIMSRTQVKTAYEHLVFDGEKGVGNFIDKWLVSNPNQLVFDDIGIFPTKGTCPDTHYNLWREFDMELVTEYDEKIVERDAVLHHIRILCGHQTDVYDYMVQWIAQMIQHPAVKSICPTLISMPGAGKGTLMKCMSKMLGVSKVYETTSPSRDVWGDFNGRMANTFLINLNELSKKETMDCEGRIKGLITDSQLTINNKGVNQYDITSHHRFIITTNNEEPIVTKTGDRRNLVIRCSDEKCNDKEYFKQLNVYLDDSDVVKTLYEYFKSIPNMDSFNSIQMPITEYQQDLKQVATSPIEMWLKSFAVKHERATDPIELVGIDQFALFKSWCFENQTKYDCTTTQFSVRLKRLKICGVINGRHTKKGNTTFFDINMLKNYFQIGELSEAPTTLDCDEE